MCLAVPAKILQMEGGETRKAVVDLHGNRLTVSLVLVPDATLGDWVLVHAGFAIQKLDAEAAKETFAIMAEIDALSGDAEIELTCGGNGASRA